MVLGELRVKQPNQRGVHARLGFVAHHGFGGGRMLGSRVMNRVRFADNFPLAHLVFMGHDHTKLAIPGQGLVVDDTSEDGVGVVKRYYIGTGSFLKGYASGRKRGSYIEEKGLPPAQLGVSIVSVQLEMDGKQPRLDYHVSI